MKKITVFIDAANHNCAQKKLGWSVDAERLLDYCKDFGEVIEARYYTGVAPDAATNSFLRWLAFHGYTLVTKPIKYIRDAVTGQVFRKCNADGSVILDAMIRIDQYDAFWIFSGDSDYDPLLQHLKACGKEVKVISTRDVVSTELVSTAGMNYIDLADIRDRIERKRPETTPAA